MDVGVWINRLTRFCVITLYGNMNNMCIIDQIFDRIDTVGLQIVLMYM